MFIKLFVYCGARCSECILRIRAHLNQFFILESQAETSMRTCLLYHWLKSRKVASYVVVKSRILLGLAKLFRTHLFRTFKTFFVQNVFIGHVFIVLNKFY